MAFQKKVWKDRLVEFAGRRTLKKVSGSADSTMVVDVTRNEGTVSQAGDAFSAANMNDLEGRIADAFADVTDSSVKQTNTTGSANYRVLLSYNANDTTQTVGARKSAKLYFNPSTGTLTVDGKVVGAAILTDPAAVSANTAAGYLASALAVKKMANNMGVSVKNGKLVWTNAWGADTELPFSATLIKAVTAYTDEITYTFTDDYAKVFVVVSISIFGRVDVYGTISITNDRKITTLSQNKTSKVNDAITHGVAMSVYQIDDVKKKDVITFEKISDYPAYHVGTCLIFGV